jgi:hypothetical protein
MSIEGVRRKIKAQPVLEDKPPQAPPPGDEVVRDSMAILLAMANGQIPFDHNRFRCACAVLPHQYAKLNETRSMNAVGVTHFDPYSQLRSLDDARRRAIAAKERFWVIEGGVEPV